ncbi:glycerol-3-phosphate responsive antiterminator [Paenibacillus sp.]|uniref:glycerol-3-phosphate responsive antiterminator n=1 Tax=Paenibacillus sp. TaxID=58172 RepID=UPI002D68EEA5|nr:glycerol-3-phosphate responsive antiterminator [Paenibacillus sp.]HZG57661.1 glycerol-3-phosphate responsive antiterminator [Paenibacillus sp.]
MAFEGQNILPAIRSMKELERALAFPYEYLVLLDTHVGQVKPIVELMRSQGKKALLHVDLIEGLKNDEAAAEFLCQQVKPAGLVSTRASVVAKTKQNGLIAIQRLFLLDTNAVEKGYKLLERSAPDYIEVMPGVLPFMIEEVRARTGIPVIAGGLIRSAADVERAIEAGAEAVTTSNAALWKTFAAGTRGERD